MDEHSIERIRRADFSLTVRGYDRNEVDRFLSELADWLETGGGEEAAGNEAVRMGLERIGEQTAAILTEAHAAAQAIRDDASASVRQQLVDANLTAESLRTDGYKQSPIRGVYRPQLRRTAAGLSQYMRVCIRSCTHAW